MRATIERVNVLGALVVALLATQAKVPERLAPLRDHSPLTKDVFARAEELRLQILVSEVVAKDGKPALERHAFRADAEYFYPASAIKLFGAIAALEKLQELRGSKPDLARTTPLRFHLLFDGDVLEDRDVTNQDGGAITLEHEIRKLFLVSDNAAFNRLYEFVGVDELAQRFEERGYRTVRIFHRLSTPRSEAENLRTPRVDLVIGQELVTIPERTAQKRAGSKAKGLAIGKGHLLDGKLVQKPLDFARKNAVTLVELQDALVMIARPEIDVGRKPFELSDDARTWLLGVAREFPAASRNPRYPRSEYPDTWGKYLLEGLTRVVPQDRLRIANKVGRAYGFSIENAYVEDRVGARAFFVTAAIYTNADGVLNDGAYEYDTIATPFLADLGEALGRLLLAP